jgi:predicted nucleic acid-binding protein
LIILLDTDILVDVALDRAPHAADAASLLDALEHRPGSAFIAWQTISNFYYLLAPTRGRPGAKAFLVDLSRFVDVARTTTESLRYAAQLEMKDFEDAMQVAAAAACGADAIATRNVRDYAKSPIRAARPGALLDKLA